MKFFCLIFLIFIIINNINCLSLSELPKDPDDSRNFTEIITSKGYPCETHKVTTPDGYILTVFRIPYGRSGPSQEPRPAVILQHGLLDSSFTWILNMPYQSLSYILADQGFDVWMTNNRGNTYGREHTTIPVDSDTFWSFSWDEMASSDFPSFISYVKNQTNHSKISFIGHSEGTTQVFAGLSENPELANSLYSFVGFGPVTHVGNIGNIGIKVLAEYDADEIVYIFDKRSFAEYPEKIEPLMQDFCRECAQCCEDVIEAICGPHKGVFNLTRMQVMASNEPGGTSVKNIVHWGQMVRKDSFAKFDYGEIGNLRKYGTKHAPAYNMNHWPANLPTFLVSGSHDELADPTDVANLIKTLPSTTKHIEMQDYAHLDFCWDIYAYQQMYPQVIQFIKQNIN